MPAISFRNATNAHGTATSSISINKPTGVVDGDYMLLMFGGDTQGQTLTTPSGWTPLDSYNVAHSATCGTFYKVAASEGASYTCAWNGTAEMGAICCAYTNPQGIESHDKTDGATGNTTWTAPSLTPNDLVDDWAVLFYYNQAVSLTIGTPSGYSLRASDSTGNTVRGYDSNGGTLSSPNAPSGSQTSSSFIAFQVILQGPAPLAGGPAPWMQQRAVALGRSIP